MKITSVYPIAILLSVLVACEVAATDERRLKSFVSSLEVVPNFLKDQAIDSVSIVEKATTRDGKLRGKAMLSRSLTKCCHGSYRKLYDETLLVNTQVIDATTDKHVDSYLVPDGERRLVENDKRVAFVFLNTNPNAHFVHDNVSVPVVEGTLVHFNGAVPHQTIVNSGVVRLLGPMYTNDFMATVGGYPEPTGKSGKTRGPAKAGKTTGGPAAKAEKTTRDAGSDSSTGDSNGDIEIPLDASMSTSLSFPAGNISGDSFGKIDEIPLDASLSMSF
jgi:hypothetical protein